MDRAVCDRMILARQLSINCCRRNTKRHSDGDDREERLTDKVSGSAPASEPFQTATTAAAAAVGGGPTARQAGRQAGRSAGRASSEAGCLMACN